MSSSAKGTCSESDESGKICLLSFCSSGGFTIDSSNEESVPLPPDSLTLTAFEELFLNLQGRRVAVVAAVAFTFSVGKHLSWITNLQFRHLSA